MILMHAAKGTQKITGARPHAFRRVNVHLAHAVAIVIACPFVLTMIDGNPLALNAMVALSFIGIRDGIG